MDIETLTSTFTSGKSKVAGANEPAAAEQDINRDA
jgi:hypothetical protein